MSVSEQTLDDLRRAFEAYKHEPSVQMWEALRHVAETIEKMAEGKLDAGTFYVSSLDPGVGKTQTIVHSVRNLSRDVGVLICVSRLAEIETLIGAMELGANEVGVYTSDDQINALGSDDPNSARVLFTTQQMVDARLKDGKRFQDLDVYYYEGRPRRVRIWDEAMLPGQELTINVDTISALPRILRRRYGRLAESLHDLVEQLRRVKNGKSFRILDIEDKHGIALRDLKPALNGVDPRIREAVEVLWGLSGKQVTVRHDPSGNTLLDYREHLPDDFAPVLILDASARVRATYRFWRDSRGNLLELTQAVKQYDNLTIHHWNTGGGKAAFRERQAKLVDGVVAAINSKPDEEWLVVVHKEDGHKILDLSAAIADLAKGDRDRVKYLTWGNHHATNDYVHIKNVVLAGTLFYPPSTYEVRARASKALPAEVKLDDGDFKAIELGEHAHLVLQAACRGSVRKCVGAQCAPCDLYLIADRRTGIPEDLRRIFPGCQVEQWEPIERPLKGKIRKAIEHLRQELVLDADLNKRVSFADHRNALGIKCRRNYNRTIRKDPRFKAILEQMQIVEVAEQGAYNSHFRRQHF